MVSDLKAEPAATQGMMPFELQTPPLEHFLGGLVLRDTVIATPRRHGTVWLGGFYGPSILFVGGRCSFIWRVGVNILSVA